MSEWKDPAVEPPPVGKRIRLRLDPEFRQRHRIPVSVVEGYVNGPRERYFGLFTTSPGPHILGWSDIPPPTLREAREEAADGRLEASLKAIGEKFKRPGWNTGAAYRLTPEDA